MKFRQKILLSACALLTSASCAHAVDRFWDNSLGGEFNNPPNWQGSTVAGPNDIAHFGLTSNPFLAQQIYTVNFSTDRTNQALKIEDDFVTFDLNGRTYSTTAATGNHIGNQPGRSGRLAIIDGTMSTALNSQLLVGDTASGMLTVSTGGRLAGGPSLRVGGQGLGTLVVNSGGFISASNTVIGPLQGTTGAATVTGVGSQFNSGPLTVGVEGSGTLSVTDVGQVRSGESTIGIRGTVTLSGASQWINSGGLFVAGAPDASGTLNVTEGSFVESGNSGVSGLVNVSASQWDLSSLTVDGSFNGGTVNLDGGGTIAAGLASPNGGGGILHGGTINVHAGTLRLAGGFFVGLAEFIPIEKPSTLNVGVAGQSNPAHVILESGNLLIGTLTTPGTGIVNVSGRGSRLTISFNALIVAPNASTGTVNITAGGSLSSPVALIGPNGTGAVTVDGTDSNWTNGGLLSIAEGSGSGTLNIQNGGRVSSPQVVVGNGGTGMLRVSSGGILAADIIEVGKGPASSGTLLIEDGDVSANSLLVSIEGDVDLSGGRLSLPSAALRSAFPSIRWTGGTLRAVGSDLTIGSGGIFGDALALSARMGLEVDGALNVNAGASLVSGGTVLAIGGTNDGSIGLIGGSLTYSQPAVNNRNLDAVRAALSVPGDGIKNAVGLTNNGTLTLADTTVNGDVHSPSGSTIKVAGGVVFNGLVSGGGNFPGAAIVTFNGGYSPGDSPASVAFQGSVVLGPLNKLEIEVAGLTPGGQHDQLVIAGPAVLDGTLSLSRLDGFVPTPYTTFEILTASSMSGVFDAIEGLDAGNGFRFATTFHPDRVRLTPALIGDLNLDRQVTISDFIDLAAHFNGFGTWVDGDLNGDFLVTISDFIDLASNFNTSFSGEVWAIDPGEAAVLADFARAHGVVAVPEPAVSLLLTPALLLWGRRRRCP